MQKPQEQPKPWVLNETDSDKDATSHQTLPPSAEKPELKIIWSHVIVFTLLHLGGGYGVYLFLTQVMWATRIFAILVGMAAAFGVTTGAHRLWSHKSYKAKLPLRILLLILNNIAFQGTIIHWARDHRTHHKYSDTDADPHNPTRGFFFSHFGWLLVRKHPDVKAKANAVDVSDLYADPLLLFQKKYYWVLATLTSFILPTYIPTLWGESIRNGFFVAMFRFIHVIHLALLINSVGHRWGNKPYDKNIKPADMKLLATTVLGESFHNYHHTFPWDYQSSELGYYSLNLTSMFIDTMAKIGWAYDLKTVSPDVIEKRAKRTGDGTHAERGY